MAALAIGAVGAVAAQRTAHAVRAVVAALAVAAVRAPRASMALIGARIAGIRFEQPRQALEVLQEVALAQLCDRRGLDRCCRIDARNASAVVLGQGLLLAVSVTLKARRNPRLPRCGAPRRRSSSRGRRRSPRIDSRPVDWPPLFPR